MFTVQRLRAGSPDLATALPLVMKFSNSIFSPDPDSKYASTTVWRQRLESPTSVILYVTSTTSPPSTSSKSVSGFLFAHPRTHVVPLRTGEKETLHIWLAGVSPEHRRLGLLQRMIDDLSTDMTGRITICTIPTRFPNMWSWLTKRGWEVERESSEGKVLLSKLIGSKST